MKIYSVQCGRVDFVKLQNDCIRKFIPDCEEFIICNNAKGTEYYESINQECKRLGIRVIDGQGRLGLTPSQEHATALNGLWQQEARFCDCLILDGDCFPFKPVAPSAWIVDFHIAAYARTHHNLTWPSPMLLACRGNLLDAESLCFSPQHKGTEYYDTGSKWGDYLTAHPDISFLPITFKWIPNDCVPKTLYEAWMPQSILRFYVSDDEKWLHFTASGHWDGSSIDNYEKRLALLHRFINHYLEL